MKTLKEGIAALRPGVFALGLAAFSLALAGCAPADYNAGTALGLQATLDSVNNKLTLGQCSGAVAQITPVYNSANTDNDVRMAMAASDGCAAGISMFPFLVSMGANVGALAGAGIWGFLAKQFPSTLGDGVAEAAQAGEDALEAVHDPGVAVLSDEMFNLDTNNPGLYAWQQRLPAANSYLFFISMAAMGSLESRYGQPDSTGAPTVLPNPLPWITPDLVTDDGCAYASAVVNFIDSLGVLATTVPGQLQSTFAAIQTTFGTAISDACVAGCTGSITVGGVAVPLGTGCNFQACSGCPSTLRNRQSCTGSSSDINSCAAAAIVSFVDNNAPIGSLGLGWPAH